MITGSVPMQTKQRFFAYFRHYTYIIRNQGGKREEFDIKLKAKKYRIMKKINEFS